MGEATQGLPFGPMTIREDLGNENPDHRSLAHGVRGDERKKAGRDDGKMLGEETPRNQSQREDVAKRADVEQTAPADPVNQPQAQKGENDVDDANPSGLQQRGLLAQARHF